MSIGLTQKCSACGRTAYLQIVCPDCRRTEEECECPPAEVEEEEAQDE